MAEKTLIIVESPAKAKTLGKFLGRKYQVLASMGHVRDLPRSQFGVDVENSFTPKYITIRGKGGTIAELRTASKKADGVLLASDPDREGEAIAWHLAHILKMDEDAPCRIEFNEITKQAVQRAIKKPRRIDGRRVDAQQARRILDRLVGYNLSPLLWRKVRKGLSAGRVQSVAVHLIVEREKEIDAFVPEEYWSLTAVLDKVGGGRIDARLVKYDGEKIAIGSREEMDRILAALDGARYIVHEVVRREKTKHPLPPFTTSTMQQEASRRLSFTTRRTMLVAQQLYEGLDLGKDGHTGLVTYIRTDSTRVAAVAQDEAAQFIKDQYGADYVPCERRHYGSKGKVQDAHEAIRPTVVARHPELVRKYLTREQFKLYELIWSRFVASQMASAIIDTTRVDIVANGYTFRATGAIVKFAGFTKVYADDREDDEESRVLPPVEKGAVLKLVRRNPKQHFTQPPPRYTEASLVKTLEEKGIGRPSTYAPVVETIQRRGYVAKTGKNLVPTDLGRRVLELLTEYFPDVINAEFTAAMENKLDRIADGELQWVQVLDEFYRPFRDEVTRAEEEIGRIPLEDEEPEVTDEICELCGRNMVIKSGRYGRFLACPGFPECKNAKPLMEDTGQVCPKCGGKVVVRRTRRGRVFYGCSAYPACDFVTWDQPVAEKCPKCGTFLVQKQGKRGKTYQCANPDCGYREKRSGER